MRHRSVLLAVLVCLFALTVFAKEKKPSEEYADKEKKFLKQIAAKYVELGAVGRKLKLFQFAREAYEEAVKYQEHNREARKWLGHVRKGRAWVPEEKKMPEQNQKAQNMTDTAFKKVTDEFADEKAKVQVYVAGKYAGLGKWCDKEGLSDQAKKAFENALRFDKDNEAARKGLGYQKVDGKWLTAKQIRARKEAKEGRLVNDTSSQYEGALGVKLNKMESAHFRIETVYGPDTLRDYIKNAETCYAYFLRDVGEEEMTDMWGKRAFLLVLGSKEQWHAYVDRFGGGDARNREFTKKTRGSLSTPSLFGVQHEGEEGDHASTVDGLVNKVAHFCAHHYWKINQAWLLEGFAYYYTVKVLDSTKTHLVALGDYNSQTGGMKEWGQSDGWKEAIKKEVSTKADPDVRMFFRQRLKDLKYNASVKSWSVISWLFDKHREKFMKWLQLVGREGLPQDEAMKEVFGWTLEELDKEWRAHVMENY